MYFQIKEIVLWPKKATFKPRRLPFELGKVNVISGASRTGKSAIIPIIDYCLGSEKCTIPVNTIRNSCDWFGIVVQTIMGQRLLARREPGNQKATGDVFILAGTEITIPDTIERKNSSIDAVKHMLDELAGLTSLDFDAQGGNVGFKGRPSFRDLGSFVFQPQNVIANPDVFFYKADTYEHREKLRTIFPYVLNAITPELMAKQYELAELRKELRRKQHELSTVRQVSERWMAEIQARVSEARELGLIEETVSANASRDDLVEILGQVAKSSMDEIRVTEETVSDAVGELIALQREEAHISQELSGLRKRFAEMSELRASTVQYQGALQVQRDRLSLSDWLLSTHDRDHKCPMCGNPLTDATEELNNLHDSLKEIERSAGDFSSVPAAFDREFERVKSAIRLVTEKLGGIRIRSQALERRSDDAKHRQFDSLRVSRFLGNLDQSLETYARIGQDSELDNEVRDLQARVASLEREISAGQIQGRTKRALAQVNSNAAKLLPDLDAERPNDPVSLSIDDLTIKVQGIEREDYLWEIGSGSNWLSYHVAVTLGLHQFFHNLKHSPVPGFIVYDQPSQVYFPKKLASAKHDTDLDPELADEDIEAVQKVFRVLSSFVTARNLGFQIIALDHAAENVWGDIANVHSVEEWRGGNKLVPVEWLEG